MYTKNDCSGSGGQSCLTATLSYRRSPSLERTECHEGAAHFSLKSVAKHSTHLATPKQRTSLIEEGVVQMHAESCGKGAKGGAEHQLTGGDHRRLCFWARGYDRKMHARRATPGVPRFGTDYFCGTSNATQNGNPEMSPFFPAAADNHELQPQHGRTQTRCPRPRPSRNGHLFPVTFSSARPTHSSRSMPAQNGKQRLSPGHIRQRGFVPFFLRSQKTKCACRPKAHIIAARQPYPRRQFLPPLLAPAQKHEPLLERKEKKHTHTQLKRRSA